MGPLDHRGHPVSPFFLVQLATLVEYFDVKFVQKPRLYHIVGFQAQCTQKQVHLLGHIAESFGHVVYAGRQVGQSDLQNIVQEYSFDHWAMNAKSCCVQSGSGTRS